MDDSDAKKAPPGFLGLRGDSSGERSARDVAELNSSILVVRTQVLCDDCGEDFTFREDVGGILFVSKALCPSCGPRWEAAAKEEHEECYIRARCPADTSFAEWVRTLRREVR